VGCGPRFIESLAVKLKKKYMQYRNDTEYDRILSNTQLHPDVATEFEETRNNIPYHRDGIPVFRNKEWMLFYNSVKVCNHSAVFTLQAFALEMARRLVKTVPNGFEKLFVGEEPIFVEKLSLKIGGWNPSNLFQGAPLLESSGIWKWWIKTISLSDKRFSATEYTRTAQLVVDPPSMKGNAAIIFQLFGIFWTVSIVCLLVEQDVGRQMLLLLAKKIRSSIAHCGKSMKQCREIKYRVKTHPISVESE